MTPVLFIGDTPCPLFENDTIIQQPVNFLTLSQTYSTAAIIYNPIDPKTPSAILLALSIAVPVSICDATYAYCIKALAAIVTTAYKYEGLSLLLAS